MRPWETAPIRPWEAQQPLFPHTLAIRRPNLNAAAGDRGYAGVTKANETLVVAALPASIQVRSRGGEPDASIPADAYGRAAFAIWIPASVLVDIAWAISENDIAVDEAGKRYQIAASELDPQGYHLLADLLKP